MEENEKKNNQKSPEGGTTETKKRCESVSVLNLEDYKTKKREGVVALMDKDYERQAAYEAAGKEAPVYGIWGFLWKITTWFRSKKKLHQVRKKTYLWLMLFTGWMGGHRWYQRRWVVAALYTAFCWTFVPLFLCITDAMEVIPIKPDENGMVIF